MTLDEIAIKHNCDKSSLHHDYCRIYEKYFAEMPMNGNFLEIGYGGYDDPFKGGESARMWLEAYPNISLAVSEIHHKENIPEGANIYYVDLSAPKPDCMTYVPYQDIIIDDGSHRNADIIGAFKNLWPILNPGGLYCVEDLHSSYDPFYEDSDMMPGSGNTAMRFFTQLAHSVNMDFIDPYMFVAHDLYDDIDYIHFYKELVIIKKKS